MAESTRCSTDSEDTRTNQTQTGHERLLREEASVLAPSHKVSDRRWRRLVLLVAVGFVLNACWTLFILTRASKYRCTLQKIQEYPARFGPGPPDLIYSPARGAVSYEVIETNTALASTNIYMGKPRKEQTLAWEEITKYRNIVVSKEDLDAINMTSIELTDGSGYLATLEVFHHIHCLDFIRMYIFRDYYDTHENETMRWRHVGKSSPPTLPNNPLPKADKWLTLDHCIEVLRASAMCQSDISLLTWRWDDSQELPFANFDVKHECRNWDNILHWTKQHQANPDAIVRPASQPWPPPHRHHISD